MRNCLKKGMEIILLYSFIPFTFCVNNKKKAWLCSLRGLHWFEDALTHRSSNNESNSRFYLQQKFKILLRYALWLSLPLFVFLMIYCFYLVFVLLHFMVEKWRARVGKSYLRWYSQNLSSVFIYNVAVTEI